MRSYTNEKSTKSQYVKASKKCAKEFPPTCSSVVEVIKSFYLCHKLFPNKTIVKGIICASISLVYTTRA